MSEPTDTSIFQRTKDVATHPTTKKSAVIGGVSTGVSAATVLVCYQLFVSHSNFATHTAAEERGRKALWDKEAAQDSRIDEANRQAEWIKGFLTGAKILPSNTSTNHL